MFGEQTGYGTGHWSIFGEKRLKLRASGVFALEATFIRTILYKEKKRRKQINCVFLQNKSKKKR